MSVASRIVPIHTRLRGRARFRVYGLRRSPMLKSRLERRLSARADVRQAAASTITGKLLVRFDPATGWRQIASAVEGLLPPADDAPASRSEPCFRPSPPASFWHQMPSADLVEAFGTSATEGLSRRDAQQRLQRFGDNTFKTSGERGRPVLLASQLKSWPLALLAAEALIALAGGAVIEPLLLTAIIAANAGVGFFVDRRAEQAIIASKKKRRPQTRVIRGGRKIDVAGESLVPGDLLVLRPGTFVGADGRIVDAHHLKIDESMLTGESIPVDKTASAMAAGSIPLADRRNMAYMGTLVVGGRGSAVVTATGQDTEYGRLHALLEETIPPRTPLIRRLHAMTGQLCRFGLAAGSGAFLAGLLGGRGLLQASGSGVAVAAAAIPAGLPSAATLNMAIGISRLKTESVAVQRLYALESLGTVEMICFDKTGTLTRSRISVLQLFAGTHRVTIHNQRFWSRAAPINPLEQRDLHQLIMTAVLCNESQVETDPQTGKRRLSGSPTEIALLYMGLLSDIDVEGAYAAHPIRAVRHRSETQRYMVTVHDAPGGRSHVFVKGDPYEVLEKCSRQLKGGRRVTLTAKAIAAIERENERMTSGALRVLGFAMGQVGRTSERIPDRDLVWLGLVGMAEPIRKGVGDMIAKLHQAGIETAMITGDQSSTAYAVARQIGLAPEAAPRLIDSSRFDAMPPELLEALTRDVRVFCRVNPSQKLQIVRGFQASGRVVAMSGDGINDGPALRAADIGIAMGLSGTDVAREVADLVLEKDNLTSINDAIREGRVAFRNLKRSVRFFITANVSDVVLAVAAVSSGWGAALWRMRPVQSNILTDLAPGLALLMEAPAPGIAAEPPRSRQAPFFAPRESLGILGEAAVISGGAAVAGLYGVTRYGIGPAAATMVFETLSAAKALHAITCRPLDAGTADSRRHRPNRFLQTALIGALGAQVATLLLPGLRRLLGIAPLRFTDMGVIGLLALATRRVNQASRNRKARKAPGDTGR